MKTVTLLVVLLLAACTSGTTINASQAITDAGIVTNGIAAVYQSFVTLYPTAIPPAQQAVVAKDLAAAQVALTTLQGASATLTTATTLAAIEADVGVVLGVMQAVPPGTLPPSVSAGIVAANVLLPIVEATIAQIQGVAVPVKAAAMTMTPDHARLVLRAAVR